MTNIRIRPRTEDELALWRLTFEVTDILDGLDWILAGAQMVIVLEHELGFSSGRTTGDVDSVIGGREAVAATQEAAGRLERRGFERSAEHPQRFIRGDEIVDLLTVDHLRNSAHAKARVEITPIPGGRRAMQTRRSVSVDVEGLGDRLVPVPSLPGAIAMKVRAFQSRRADRDTEDLVRLLRLVVDVEQVRAELKPAERRGLGRVAALRDPDGAPWRLLSNTEDARSAWERIRDE